MEDNRAADNADDRDEKDQSKADAANASADDQLSGGSGAEGGRFVLSFGHPSTDGNVYLGQHIQIFPSKSRPEFSSYGCKAFECFNKRTGKTGIAQLVPAHLLPRITNIGSYKNVKNANVLQVQEAGVVHWPAEDRQYFVLVTDMPQGQRLMADVNAKPMQIPEEQIIATMIRPMISALKELHALDIIHGGISPENIFISGPADNPTIVLGEGLTSAPFMRQPVLCETIERGMAQRTGRGVGRYENDLYCLGICVAVALRGENYMAGKSDEEITKLKIQQGSYATMLGRERVPTNLGEFLRGVLNDDERQRWGIHEVSEWLEGRHNSTKQAPSLPKAARPFIFRDEKIWDLKTMAMEFSRHVGEAAAVLEKESFFQWVKRNFDDNILHERLAKAISYKENPTREKLVCLVISAIDPQGPIRYKNLSIFPTGYAVALADAMCRGEELQPYGEILSAQLITAWISQRFEEILDSTNMITYFEKCRNYLGQRMPGYGLERIVYSLSKEVICLSPILKKFFIIGPGQMLLALESMAKGKSGADLFMDRQMIAFLSVRDQKTIEPHLGHVISNDRKHKVMGALKTYASIQKLYNTGMMPALGTWILGVIGPVLERFYDRDLRQELTKRLSKIPEPGNLNQILDLIDSASMQQEDGQKFMVAKREFAALTLEGMQINERMKRRNTFGIDVGRQIAMLLAVFISTLCILVFVLIYFFEF